MLTGAFWFSLKRQYDRIMPALHYKTLRDALSMAASRSVSQKLNMNNSNLVRVSSILLP